MGLVAWNKTYDDDDDDDYVFVVVIDNLAAPMITLVTHSRVSLSLEPPETADKYRKIEYRITYGKVGESTSRTIHTDLTSQTVTSLDEDTVYEFRVAAKYEGGRWGPDSDPARARTKESADG